MQLRGPLTYRHVGDFPYQAVPNLGLAATVTAEISGRSPATFQRGLFTVDALAGYGNPAVIQPAKTIKVRGREGRV